jgi:tyrosyl-tRNA synthetase
MPPRSKMSSSDAGGAKVDLLDSMETVHKKVMAAYCEPRTVEGNRVLIFLRAAVFPLLDLRGEPGLALPSGDVYSRFADLERAYSEGLVHPKDLKYATSRAVNYILEPLRERLLSSQEFVALMEAAYPPS